MAKTKYQCQKCQYITGKWQGKCPECGAWNSFQEIPAVEDSLPPAAQTINKDLIPKPESIFEVLANIQSSPDRRFYSFGNPLLDEFWNQGLVAGSFTLLAGEPGLGKSTLALQLLRSLYKAGDKQPPGLLYVTAEESTFELARRSQRLQIPPQIMVLQSNSLEQIIRVLETSQPQVVIIDSIQTIFTNQSSSNPGSVGQVSTIASHLLAYSKAHNLSVIIIGHVTKDGQIAGPKTLEHLVDSVLLLESAESSQYRTLSFQKHRFGSTNNLLLLKMEATGLEIVTDPSLALLENLETGVGVTYAMAMDKDLPLVVEIQALVSMGVEGNFYGRRETLGIKTSKLNTILAIAEKYLGMDLKSRDIYVQVSGLPSKASDDSLDLPILLSLLSSWQNQPLKGKVTRGSDPGKIVYAGRLTLSGNLRQATHEESRGHAAKKLGFGFNPQIELGSLGKALEFYLSRK